MATKQDLAVKLNLLASNMAAKCPATFTAIADRLEDARKTMDGGPLVLYSQVLCPMLLEIDAQGNVVKDGILAAPYPDSQSKKPDEPLYVNPDGNHGLPDKYTQKIPGGEEVSYSVWSNWLAQTQWGMANRTHRQFIQDLLDGKSNDNASKPEFARYFEKGEDGNKRYGVASLTTARKDYDRWFQAVLSRVKLALRYHHKCREIAERMPKVGIGFTYPDMERVFTTSTPIVMWQTDAKPGTLPFTTKPMGLTTFLGLDVEKALAEGGSCSDLYDTAKKGADDNASDGNQDGSKTPAIETVAQLEATCAQVASFLLDADKYKFLIAMIGNKGISDSAALAIGDCADALEALASHIEKQIEKARDVRDAAKAKEQADALERAKNKQQAQG